jgi:hypothetical protein
MKLISDGQIGVDRAAWRRQSRVGLRYGGPWARPPATQLRGWSVLGQIRLFDDVEAMSAAPPIAAGCFTAVSGASGQPAATRTLRIRPKLV